MRQRGSIIRPRGARRSWSVKYRTEAGLQRFKSGFRTRSEAQVYLNEVLSQINAGTYLERKPITFEAFAQEWLTGRRQIRGSTESGYGSVIRKQLVPRLGGLRVCDLRMDHIEALVTGIIEDELSPKSLHNIITLLRTMLVGKQGPSATRRGYIQHDPTLGVELPSLQTRQITPPTPQQVWQLIDAARDMGSAAYPITFLGAFTGLRRNEALAVRFSDVDWFTHELRVRTAISKQRGTDGAHKWEWVVGPPKSHRSLRRLALTDSVLKMLAEMKSMASDTEGFVFTDNGSFIDPDKFDAEIWAAVTAKAGMTGTRYHDLRHFFASQLIAQGETAAHVRDQMGHSSIRVTFDTYGHLFPGAGREAAQRYEQSMHDARAKSTPNGSNLVAKDGTEGATGRPEGSGASSVKN